METSAKVNGGVEEASFPLARSVDTRHAKAPLNFMLYRDCKTRLIDSQADATGPSGGPGNTDGSIKVDRPAMQTPGCGRSWIL